MLADIIFIVVAFFSTNRLLEKVKDDPSFLIFGGVLLVAYGFISFIKTSKSFRNIVKEYHKVEIKKGYGKLFLKGFLLNFINIGVLVFWLGVVVVTGPSFENSINRFVVFFSTLLIAYFLTDLVKIILAKQLKKKLTPKIIIKTKKILGALLVICGLILIIKGFLPKDSLNPQNIIEEIR